MGTGDVVLSYLLAIAQTIFFAISTWRMEAAVTRHPGQSVALTAAQVVVVGICSAAWAVLESGEMKRAHACRIRSPVRPNMLSRKRSQRAVLLASDQRFSL